MNPPTKHKGKHLFTAHRFSGLSGSFFLTSVVLDIFRMHNLRSAFAAPFYGLTGDVKSGTFGEWIDEAGYERVAQKMVSIARREGVRFLEAVKRQIKHEADELCVAGRTTQLGLKQLTDTQLIERYNSFVQRYTYNYGLGIVTFLYEAPLSEELAQSLSSRSVDTARIVSMLLETKYKSFMLASQNLLAAIQTEQRAAHRRQLIDRYRQEFYYILGNYTYTAPLTRRDVTALATAHTDRRPAAAGWHRGRHFSLRPREKAIIAILRETGVIRDQRKRINCIGSYVMCRFMDEVSRRHRVPRALAYRSFWFELPQLVFAPPTLLPKLRKRHEVSFILDGRNSYYLEYLAVREEAVRSKLDQRLHGTPASYGRISGRVCVVLGPRDFKKFRRGDVLVAEMTRPDFLPLMHRASAIVTDEGGLTSHAAIVARELNVPCIVGTKIATRVLKNGDRVEVNASSGIVRKVRA